MSEKEITKKYTNGEVTIVWKPGLCIHAGICGKLPGVFDSRKKPWIDPNGATTEEIINQVKQCPSAALSYYMNHERAGEVKVEHEVIIEASKNGPLLVYGNILIKDSEGKETRQNKVTAFCRCGQSSNKPYCDGSHRKVDFKG